MSTELRPWLFVAAVLALPACGDSPTVEKAPPNFEMTSPANAAIGVPGSPVLTWNPSFGATSYRVQISADAQFSTLVSDQSGLTTTSFSPTVTLAPGTVYFWRVIADTPSGPVPADAAPFSFTTVAPVPGDFTLVAPESGSIGVPTRPTFEWTSSLGAGSYRLQVATDSSFSTPVIDQSGLVTTSTTPTTALNLATQYFWRVQAVSDSVVTADGAPRSFTTAVGAIPGSFTLVSPAGGSTVFTTLPTYSWTSSSGASSYRLEVSTDPSFLNPIIDQTGITTTSVTPSIALLPLTTYFWRVRSVNASGITIATAAPLTFQTG
jgi:hypothetical protein